VRVLGSKKASARMVPASAPHPPLSCTKARQHDALSTNDSTSSLLTPSTETRCRKGILSSIFLATKRVLCHYLKNDEICFVVARATQ
jgi:hypothetical protein